MKRKLLSVLIAVAAVVCLALGLSACGHVHTFAKTWTSDETGHWHVATCEHKEERDGFSAHIYQNGKCMECNYEHKNHTYANGKCTECEYEHEDHTFGGYEKDEEGHSQTCTVCGKTVTEGHTYANGVCEDCEYEHVNHAFVYSEKTEAEHTGTCSECGKTVTEAHTYENGTCKNCNYVHQNHNYGAGNTCSICGAKKPYTKSGDDTKIYFGEYPQTEVTDENDSDKSLRNSLNMAAGSEPTAGVPGKWTSYGYYLSGAVSEFMWYIDVEYQESRYRGVYFTSYRPYDTTSANASSGYQGDNGYNINTVYWFKYERIEWRILEEKDETALLMANIILDSQQYYRTGSQSTRTVDGKTVYENNYKESDIRAWLNGTFYETAFDVLAKQIIETTAVDNSLASTGFSSDSYVCENTQDKVFLLSYQEVLNVFYGFSSSNTTYDTARQLKSTDYAKSQGVYVSADSSYGGNSWWWLRSPYGEYGCYASGVDLRGGALYYNSVDDTSGGVVPAVWIKL